MVRLGGMTPREARRAATPGAAAVAASEAAAVSTAVAAAWPVAAAKAAAVTVRPLAESAAICKPAAIAGTLFEEPVALVPAATATVAFTPSVETHARH